MLLARRSDLLRSVLRCAPADTGPLFEKYNAILRAANAAFFQSALESLGCATNRYETSLHVLSAAITKLGKLTQAAVVYRAPGRALPPAFWQNACDGLAGIIETGCLSTSSNKDVALEYARRSPLTPSFSSTSTLRAMGPHPLCPPAPVRVAVPQVRPPL